MTNFAGVFAVLAVIFRPSLVVPHVQVPDIRHLDWEALHANGVRFLVFDKDNCLTAPHSDVLEPSITDAWERCQRVFGRENILIVSNSSGSSSDPSGLGAESLSRALNVPVLCHRDKKPAKGCAAEALEYFVALSHDRETTLAQARHMPPGSASLVSGPSRQAKMYLKERRKVLSSQVPGDAEGHGSIMLVGDRTMTDVVVAHRMNDELSRRRKRLGLDNPNLASDASIYPAETNPSPQCVSVLTTGIWAYEGRINAVLRRLEMRVTSYLISKGFQPGAPGLIALHKATARTPTNWQKIATNANAFSTRTIARPAEDELERFAYTGDRVPPASPLQPTLGSILIATIVRPLPPRIATLFTSILSSRPFMWISTNLRDGWIVMMKGLEFGVREAGLPSSRRSRRTMHDSGASLLPAASPALARSGAQLDEVLPESKARTKEGEVTASLAKFIESRVSDVHSSLPAVSGAAQQLRNRFSSSASSVSMFSAQSILTRFSAASSPKSASTPAAPSVPTASIAHRTFHTSGCLRLQQPPPQSGAKAPRPRVPRSNWIAALAALVIVPASYYAGMRLHDLKDSKDIDPTQPLPPTPAAPTPALHQHQAQDTELIRSEASVSNALVKAHSQRKRELELTLFHLVREREDILDKLERVHQRRHSSES